MLVVSLLQTKSFLDNKEHQGYELEEVEFKCVKCMYFYKTLKHLMITC